MDNGMWEAQGNGEGGGGIRYTGSVDSIIFLYFAALCGE